MELAEYYAEQERVRSNAIRRGDLVLSDEPDEDPRSLRLASSDKAEIAAIKSIASGLNKGVTDALKAIGKAKDASAVKAAVTEATTTISKQLKRLGAYAENLEGEFDDDELAGDDSSDSEEAPPTRRSAKRKDAKPHGKAAKAVAASHSKLRSLRLANDEDEEVAELLVDFQDFLGEIETTLKSLKAKAPKVKDFEQLKALGNEVGKLGTRITTNIRTLI